MNEIESATGVRACVVKALRARAHSNIPPLALVSFVSSPSGVPFRYYFFVPSFTRKQRFLAFVCFLSRLFAVTCQSNAVKMSGGYDVLAMKEDDVTKMLAAGVHLGDSNVNFQMQQYVYKVRNNGRLVSDDTSRRSLHVPWLCRYGYNQPS